MTKFTEGRHPGEFLMSEGNGWLSRGKAIIKAGSGVIVPGTVLGFVSTGSAAAGIKAGGNTGNGVVTMDATTPLQSGVKAGAYTVRFTAATAYVVEDPNGDVIGNGVLGTPFNDDIKFNIAAGGTAFVAGDGFDITVSLTSRKAAPSPDAVTTGIEGAEIAKAIALYGCDATSVDVEITVMERDVEVNRSKLVWDASVNTDAKKNAKLAVLADRGIIAR